MDKGVLNRFRNMPMSRIAPLAGALLADTMSAYSNGNKIICYFRSTKKFGERYMTFGFNDAAKLDEGTLWPIVYAFTEMTTENEATLQAIVKKAVITD